jgi:drug/metabolite transporter (DMT)-like permease
MANIPFKRPILIGFLLAVLSAVCFGSAGPVTKALSTAGLSALQITQARMILAALIMLLVALSRNPRHLLVKVSEWPLIVGFGVLAFCMNQSLYTVAVSRLPVGIALLLEYLAPVMIVLWIRLVRRAPLPPAIWLGCVAVLVGLALVGEVWAAFSFDALGVIAGVGTAVALAARFLLTERGLLTRDPIALSALGATIGAIALSVLAPPSEFPWRNAMVETARLGSTEIPLWALIAWLSVVSTVVAYFTGVSAQRYLPSSTMSQLATLEVLFAAAFASLLLGERLTAIQVTGGMIMLAGIITAQMMIARYKLRRSLTDSISVMDTSKASTSVFITTRH